MSSCCEDKACEVGALRESHGRVLWVVLGINSLMFVVEGGAGLLAHSTSLLADALDMLGDALVYGFSLFVLARSVRWQAGAALAGGLMLAWPAVRRKLVFTVMPARDDQRRGDVAMLANLRRVANGVSSSRWRGYLLADRK